MGLPEERPDGLDSPRAITFIKYMSRAQVAVFKATNGRIGNTWRIGAGWKKPVPVLLLEHVGRKSGKAFVAPLLYMEDGRDVIVVASQGGLPKNPQWYANLAAHPDTRISLKGERDRPVRARTATPDERERLWPRLVEMYDDFAKYEKWTERTIPVVVLEPR
jgi:F420H(2)-dependent quinone reductase